MNKKEAFRLGYERGWNGASWQDMPAIGDTLPRDLDWQGIGTIETVADQIDAWEIMCAEAESQSRDFSPFEFTAHAINESRDPDGYWQAFDDGIRAGRAAYRRKHFPLAKLRRYAKEEERA